MTRLNLVGAELAKDARVHAMTDVTGFGLLGHALEMARGRRRDRAAAVRRCADARPGGKPRPGRLFDRRLAAQLVKLRRRGRPAGGLSRTGGAVCLTDPQTSGGLLVACDAEAAPALCARIRQGGDPGARDRRRRRARRVRSSGSSTDAGALEAGGGEWESNPPGTDSLPHTDLKSGRPTGDNSPPGRFGNAFNRFRTGPADAG